MHYVACSSGYCVATLHAHILPNAFLKEEKSADPYTGSDYNGEIIFVLATIVRDII